MRRKIICVVFVSLGAFLVYSIAPPSLSPQGQVVLAVLFVAAVLWLSEILPLFITSFIIAFLLIVWGGFGTQQVFRPFFDPIIVLFLGGFILARAFSRYSLDQLISERILQVIGRKTNLVVFALMSLSATLSMWMSNTASAALLLPISSEILQASQVEKDDQLWKRFPLAVAYAATLGGLGTLIGSPPNALAQRFLQQGGVEISFLDWMIYMLPLVVILMPVILLVLTLLFRSDVETLEIHHRELPALDLKAKVVAAVTVLCMLLWLTGEQTGLSSYVVALIPIIIFFTFDLLGEDDLKVLHWETLILFGGGITLGEAVSASGVDALIADSLATLITGLPPLVLLIVTAFVGLIMTVVASNTGAAVLMMPIVMGLSRQLGLDPLPLVLVTTCGVSLDFILPVGTPPSALAYSTGQIRTDEMARAGLLLTIFVILVPALYAHWLF
ncbi:MAG: SLC13 family permease [Anaerolineae bacterium]